MNYEEKMLRYVASKLIQKKYFLKKGGFPSEKKLIGYIQEVLDDLKQVHRQLTLVRTHSPHGLITPAVRESVDKLIF